MVSARTRRRGRYALTAVLTVALLAGLAGVVYLAAMPNDQTDPKTEFYLLGPDGVADEYPTDLAVEERGEFIVGVTNNEHREMTYTVIVRAEGTRVVEEQVTLNEGETWEEPVTVAFESPGTHRVDLTLYRGQSATGGDPYRELWFDVEVDP